VWKTEIQFGLGFKNRTIQNFDICSDCFLIETVRNLPLNESE